MGRGTQCCGERARIISVAGVHAPLCWSSQDRNEQPHASSSGALATQGSSLGRLGPLTGLTSPAGLGSFAASPLLPGQRRMGLAGHQQRASALAQLAAQPNGAQALRSYYTEGEIFGSTFMYTTNMMFWAGIVGAVAFRRNLIILLLSAETVMLACNMNFLFAAAYLNDVTGELLCRTAVCA